MTGEEFIRRDRESWNVKARREQQQHLAAQRLLIREDEKRIRRALVAQRRILHVVPTSRDHLLDQLQAVHGSAA